MKQMQIEQERLDKTKKEAEEFYKSIGDVHCPYLKERVAFNAKGLDHIKFKEWNKARSIVDQYMRLRLLRLAPDIVRNSNTLQEFFETNRFERQKINSRWEQRMIRVKYYGFVAIINRSRIKVIVKEIEGGNKFFWSIIPFWKIKKDPFAKTIKKILHEGDLETQ